MAEGKDFAIDMRERAARGIRKSPYQAKYYTKRDQQIGLGLRGREKVEY